MTLSVSVDGGRSQARAASRWRGGALLLALMLVAALASAASAGATVFSATATTVAATQPGKAVALGDLDGDGDPDLVEVGGATSTPVSVRLNDGSGNFTPTGTTVPQTSLSTPTGVAIGDLNGDGAADFVVVNRTTGAIRSFRKNGGAYTGAAMTSTSLTGNPQGVAIGDLNGDGKLDVAVATNTGGVTLLFRTSATGAGTTIVAADYTAVTLPAPDAPATLDSIAIGDLDGDHQADDLAVSLHGANAVGVYIHANPGTGASDYPLTTLSTGFVPGCPTDTPMTCPAGTQTQPVGVAIGDLDGDGSQDLATADLNPFSQAGTVGTFLNNGSGSAFTAGTPLVAAQAQSGGPQTSAVAVGDLDGDGRLDIVAASKNDTSSGGASTISVFLKNAGSGYTETTLSATGSGAGSLALADVAGAGKLDVVTGNSSDSANPVTLFANTTAQGTSTSLAASPPSPQTAGTSVTFTATVAKIVSGLRGSAAPGGSVTFAVDGGPPGSPVALSSGSAAFSTSGLTAGPHTIVAQYSGDANYAASTASLPYTVTGALASPSLSSQASGSVTAGGNVSDVALLSGGSSPGGSVTFKVYGPEAPGCTGTPRQTFTVGVSGNGTYASGSYATDVAGTYKWVASYSGDGANSPVVGVCDGANESVNVTVAATGTTPIGVPTRTAYPPGTPSGHAEQDVTVSDNAGLSSVGPFSVDNCTVFLGSSSGARVDNVPLTALDGHQLSVVLTAVKTTEGQLARWSFVATNAAGHSTTLH